MKKTILTRFICAGVLTVLALLAMPAATTAATPAASPVQIGVVVRFGPPEIPVYEQPICPGDGYIWTPGYWAWDPDDADYYWVPGTWILAPEVGFLWTPGWWGWGGAGFIWHVGYWGPHVGFYGGINYGFGYFGQGYEGGRWDGGHFFYNTTINRVNITEIHNVYNTRIDIRNESRVSFNGGEGGINARASAEEEAAARDRHIDAVRAQTDHAQAARGERDLRASVNHGKPSIAATSRAGDFRGSGVVRASGGGNYNPPPKGGGNEGRGGNPVHVKDLPPAKTFTPPNTGNTKLDQKYQQQQQKLQAQQDKERQNLQQKQEQEHQQQAQQNANAAKQQQLEQRHQQQTQQLQQKHDQQRQQLEQKQSKGRK